VDFKRLVLTGKNPGGEKNWKIVAQKRVLTLRAKKKGKGKAGLATPTISLVKRLTIDLKKHGKRRGQGGGLKRGGREKKSAG